MLCQCLSMFTKLNNLKIKRQFFLKYILYIYVQREKREIKMSNFSTGNLLSTVQKKVFPNGIAFDVMQRLDSMDVFHPVQLDNLDAFDGAGLNVQQKAMNLFHTTDLQNSDAVKNACQGLGLRVKVDSVETKYVADAEQTGSVSVYTLTDKRGNVVELNNINAKQYIDEEKQSFDDMLQGVIDEINTGSISLPEMNEEEIAA